MTVRMKEKYQSEVLPALKDKLGVKNPHLIPKIEKICLNMGMGRDDTDDTKKMDQAQQDMALIAGQWPAQTQARVSVSNFRLREGMRLGCRVTLRGQRMYEFLDRLINVAIPRIRDFRGLKRSGFDKQGNFSMGVEEITIFPEVNPDNSDVARGMDITFVIKQTEGPEQSIALLESLGMPFVRDSE